MQSTFPNTLTWNYKNQEIYKITATNFESKIIISEKSFAYYRNMSAALALAGLETLNKMLDGVKGSVVDNEHMFAIWNDWKGRDGRERIERT